MGGHVTVSLLEWAALVGQHSKPLIKTCWSSQLPNFRTSVCALEAIDTEGFRRAWKLMFTGVTDASAHAAPSILASWHDLRPYCEHYISRFTKNLVGVQLDNIGHI